MVSLSQIKECEMLKMFFPNKEKEQFSKWRIVWFEQK